MNSGQCEQSPKVAPTVAIDERAEFEKWANKHKGGDPLKANENGSYPNPFANAAYEAWQAARKLSAPEVVSKTTDTLVPDAKDEIDHDGIWTNSDVAEQRYIQGWNDCRAEMLKGEK